jgi:hypothetical protein
MIVTMVAETIRTLSGTAAETHSHSLVRRGTEKAWFGVRGGGELIDRDDITRPLHCYTVATCPLDSGTRLCTGTQGMQVLLLAVFPKGLATVMPARCQRPHNSDGSDEEIEPRLVEVERPSPSRELPCDTYWMVSQKCLDGN